MPIPPPFSTSTFLAPAAALHAGDDPIFALNAEARRRAAAGEDIVNATLGALLEDDGTLAIMPSVVDALRAVPAREAAAYAPIAGVRTFLDAVRRDLVGGTPLDALAGATATPGGSGALALAISCFLDPGQSLLAPRWFWGPYATMAEHAGRRVGTFSMFDARGRLDLAALESGLHRDLERQGRALLLCNFPCNNPTGYSLDAAEWAGVAALVRDAGRKGPVTFVLDHAYARFANPGGEVGPATDPASSWRDHVGVMLETALVLVAWTASKSFAQYGARVGALLALCPDAGERQRIAGALSFACRGTWSNCNHLGMLGIAQVLTDPALQPRVRAERGRLTDLLRRRVAAFNAEAARCSLSHPRYEGGFFVAVFADDAPAAAARMRERGVFVVPMDGALRVALCSTPEKDVPRVVETIAACI